MSTVEIIPGEGNAMSPSRLTSYLGCPRKYRYRYKDKAAEERTPIALLFGSAIHEAAESWFKSFNVKQLPVNEVRATFLRAFTDMVKMATERDKPVDWGKDDRAALEMMGKAMMDALVGQTADKPLKVWGTEVAFEIELVEGNTVRGFIDLILDDGEGRYIVVDLKTSAKAYGPDKLLYDHQPTIYIAAAERMLEAPGKVSFEYWVLSKTKAPTLRVLPAHRDERDRLELMETLRDVQQAIAADVFPRHRSFMCKGCQFADRCEAEILERYDEHLTVALCEKGGGL